MRDALSRRARSFSIRSLRVGIGRIAQHQVAQRIDEVDVTGRVSRRGKLGKERVRWCARDVHARVIGEEHGIGRSGVGDEPDALDPFGVLPLREAHLAHVEELLAAALDADSRIDQQHHPFAAQLRKPEGAAIEAPQPGIGKRVRLDQLAVVQPGLRRPDEISEPGRDRGRGAKREDDERNAPAAAARGFSRDRLARSRGRHRESRRGPRTNTTAARSCDAARRPCRSAPIRAQGRPARRSSARSRRAEV